MDLFILLLIVRGFEGGYRKFTNSRIVRDVRGKRTMYCGEKCAEVNFFTFVRYKKFLL